MGQFHEQIRRTVRVFNTSFSLSIGLQFVAKMRGLWLSTIVVISLAFWLSLNDVERTMQPWALRKSLLYYTGVVAMAMISIGMILALRLPFLERLTGGLDRSYRLHKWVGITGALFALMHWLIKTQPK